MADFWEHEEGYEVALRSFYYYGWIKAMAQCNVNESF